MNKLHWDNMTTDEREMYVSQDYKSQQELLIPFIENIAAPHLEDVEDDETFWGCIKFDTPAKLKAIIIVLHNDGMRTSEIGYHLPCSRRYIRRIVAEYKKKNRN